jgi:FkbM family methyltransferase
MPYFKGIGNKFKTVTLLLIIVSYISAIFVWHLGFDHVSLMNYFESLAYNGLTAPIPQHPIEALDDGLQYVVKCEDYRNDTNYDNARNVRATRTTPSFPMAVHRINHDKIVSKAIYKKGCFNCGILTAAMKYLKEDNNSIFLDIGSNIGLFALNAAAMGRQAFAFEPHKKNWLKICGTLTLGNNAVRIKPNLKLFGVALSRNGPKIVRYHQRFERNPSAMMIKSLDNNSSLETLKLGIDYGWAISLDSLQDVLPLDRPVVLKVDVEGHECETLSGALEYLRKVNLKAAFVEFRGNTLQNCDMLQSILELFFSKGLLPHQIHDSEQESSLNATKIIPSSETYWEGDYQFSKEINT